MRLNKLIASILAVVMLISCIGMTALAADGLAGTGTAADPYVISDLADLEWFRDDVNAGNNYSGKTVALAADIDLASQEWTPIGNSKAPFNGTFDGGNNTISNLVITGNNSDVGLFGLTKNGEVKNLTINNAKVSGYLNVGALAGTPYTSKYTNINLTGHVEINGFAYVGGLFGKNAYANLTNITINVDDDSYVNANSVSGTTAYRTYVGGVVGFMGEGGHKVENVKSNIDVIGSTCDVGGISGIAHYGNSFINCSCSGDVTITNADELASALEIGGIAGVWNNGGAAVTFDACTYSGTITSTYSDANGESVTLTSSDLANGGIIGSAYSASGTGELVVENMALGTLPNAEVTELGALTVDEYGVYVGNGLSEGTGPMDLQVAMEFIANDTADEAKANAYAEYTTDFFITVDGMAGDSIVADGCYLAGHYGDIGWVKVPLDGFTIENGKIYPVITSVGLDFSYVDICTSVEDFMCGIYFSDEILAANPDLSVTLELGLSENMAAAQAAEFITIDEPYVYTVADLKGELAVDKTLPNAEVLVLEATTIDEYRVYDAANHKIVNSDGTPVDVQIAMEFIAKDSVEEAKKNYYANYTTDFFIEFNGMANGTFNADGSYLIGHYGDWGWIKVPLDGMIIEEGKVYPVITSVGFDFSYVDICDSVKDFKCGIYVSEDVLDANPDLEVTLTLGLSENAEAAQNSEFIVVDEPYTYLFNEHVDTTIVTTGKSLILDGVIYINYYTSYRNFEGLTDADIVANGGVLVWDSEPADPVAGTETYAMTGLKKTGYTYEGFDEYTVRSEGIAAKEYADEFYFRPYIVIDGEYVYGDLETYSVRQYCENQLAKAKTAQALKDVCVAMLNYGAAAQINFNYNTADLANANFTADQKVLTWDDALLTPVVEADESMFGAFASTDDMNITAKSISLDGAVRATVYADANNFDATESMIYFWSQEAYNEIVAAGGEFTAENSTYHWGPAIVDSGAYGMEYKSYGPHIPAKEYSNTLYIAAYAVDAEGNAHSSGILAYSPEAYAAAKLAKASTTDELKTLVKWLVVYGDKAATYFAK